MNMIDMMAGVFKDKEAMDIARAEMQIANILERLEKSTVMSIDSLRIKDINISAEHHGTDRIFRTVTINTKQSDAVNSWG